jgi:hypothetical protein
MAWWRVTDAGGKRLLTMTKPITANTTIFREGIISKMMYESKKRGSCREKEYENGNRSKDRCSERQKKILIKTAVIKPMIAANIIIPTGSNRSLPWK